MLKLFNIKYFVIRNICYVLIMSTTIKKYAIFILYLFLFKNNILSIEVINLPLYFETNGRAQFLIIYEWTKKSTLLINNFFRYYIKYFPLEG